MNKRLWVIIIDLILFLFVHTSGFIVYAQSKSDEPVSTTVAEQIIIDSIETGDVADLSILPNENDRIISADFFENLLMGRVVPISTKGIFIENVTVDGNVKLTNEVIPITNMTNCKFTGAVNLQGSRFENLSFSFCTFQKRANLSKTTILDAAYFDNTNFGDGADFSFTNIRNNLDFNSANFSSQETTYFNNIDIGYNVSANKTTFEGPVDFSYARIGGLLDFSETEFNSVGESNFNSITVADSAFFNNGTFLGPLDFGHTKIGANFDFNNAKFNSQDKLLFNSMEISGSLICRGALFSGSVFLLYTQIGGLMDCSDTNFLSPYIASFGFLGIEYGVNFQRATFNGPVNFGYVDITGPLNFSEAQFLSSDNTIAFSNLNVEGDFLLSNSSVYGGLAINNAKITNAIKGDGIKFLTNDKTISINNTTSQSLLLNIATLTYTASFMNCTFEDYYLSGPPQKIKFASLNLSGTKIMQDLKIENITVKDFVGQNLMGYGKATINNTSIEESADLSLAKLNTFTFQNVLWPNVASKFDLDGFSYNEIIPGENLNDENWHEVLDLINTANYNVALYKNLEIYFESYGHSDWSNIVLVKQKRRERSELLQWYSSPSWWSNLALDLLVLYGLEPGRMIFYSLFIIIFGGIIFKRENMKRVGNNGQLYPIRRDDKLYESFWYSADLFIPFIDLGAGKKWEPSSKILRNYKRVQIILGWIAIPIALISITGIFK